MNDNSSPVLVPLKKIKPNPFQPRIAEDVAATEEVAINIYRNGLLQIPSARAVNGHYELVFGHTRKAAYELLATQGVPAAEIPADKRFSEMPLYIHTLDDKQMFEMAVAENIKRRDLNPIETASAMQRYMNDFEATSKQAAELFGVNDATVRGKVRLLDLPEQAQEKIASGAMSEGTGRSLLSMQKVASPKAVEDVIKKIEKDNGNNLPDEVIENHLDRLAGTIRMWDENSWDGKPRGNNQHSWLLDMRNFPNNLLPTLTPVDIATTLGVEDDKRILKQIDKAFEEEASVDALKKSLADHPEMIAKIDHLINPPACTACPFYTKVRGTHYCGNKLCHDRKTQAWRAGMIESASKNLKIDIYAASDGKYVILDSSTHGSMFVKRDKTLRLISVEKAGRHYQWFAGVEDDVFMVCVVGDGIARLPKKSVYRRGSTTVVTGRIDYAEIKARQLYKAKRQVLIWEFTKYAKHLFDACAWPILHTLDDWNRLGYEDEPPADVVVGDNNKDAAAKSEYRRRLLIWKIVEYRDTGGEVLNLNKLVKVANRLAGHAEKWGVKFPKELMQMAVEGDAEVDALLKSLRARKAARVVAETAKAKKAKKK